MARGIAAVVVIASLIFSMTILGGVGFYALLGTDVDVEGQNEDVQRAASQLDEVTFGEGRSASILEGPLAAVTPFIRMLQVFTGVLTNTSGVIQLLYGLPKGVADTIETMFRFAMAVTVMFGIRGLMQ